MTEPGAQRRAGGRQIIPRPNDWTPGTDTPWVPDANPTLTDLLAGVSPDVALPPASADVRHSAVLVLLTDHGDGPEVLLTRRSWELRNHRGEISFPGGRMDPGESATDAALREAHEEVGLDPTLVTVHGELTHLSTFVSQSYIVPKVATVSAPVHLVPHAAEVERVMWVGVADLMRPHTHHTEQWGPVSSRHELHFFELDDETVWGATARILVDLFRRAIR